MSQDREKDFKGVFRFLKRWANSPSYPNYTIGYSAGNADKEPAKITFDYMLVLEGYNTTNFEEKLDLLYVFLNKEEEKQSKKTVMGTPFYRNIQSHIRRERVKIENGEPIQTRRK